MSALASIFGGRSDVTNPAKWLIEGFGGRARTHSGQPVSPDRALTLPCYYGIIKVIAEDVAKTPLTVIREIGNDREILSDHPVDFLLQESPNDEMIPFTFVETLTHYAASWGDGIAEIEWSGTKPVAFHPIHPSRVNMLRDPAHDIVYDVYMEDGTVVRFPASDILDIRGFGDGLKGYSLARYAAESIGLGLAAQQFGAQFFGNGARTDVVITHPKALTDKAHEHIRASWIKTYGGDNNFVPAILEEGMTVEKLSIPPEEAQFLETRKLQTIDVCGIARVDPSKIQHLEHVKFNNYEALVINHVNDCLTPWVKRWEQELKRKCLRGERGVRVKGDFRSQLRGDHTTRAMYYDTLTRIGVMSRNQVCALEDLPDLGPEGDKRTMPLNMGPADSVANGDNASRAGKPGVDNNSRPVVPPANDKAKAAQRRVFVSIVDELVRKEGNAINRLVKKERVNSDGYLDGVAKFAVALRTHAAESIHPAVLALAELMEAVDPEYCARIACDLWVNDYIVVYYTACEDAIRAGAYDAKDRAETSSDRLIQFLEAVLAVSREKVHAQS